MEPLKFKTRNGVSYGIWFSRNVTSSKQKGVPGHQKGQVTKQHHQVRISWCTRPQHLNHCCIVRTEFHALCRPLMTPQGSCQNNRKEFFVAMDKGICNEDHLPVNHSLPKIATYPTEPVASEETWRSGIGAQWRKNRTSMVPTKPGRAAEKYEKPREYQQTYN